MSVVKLTVENFEQEVLQAEKLVLVDFYADWCGPCKMMSPIVDEIAEEESEIKVCNINIDQAMEIAQKRWDSIAKPLHSLGKLETLLIQIAGITGNAEVDLSRRGLIAMCADNGVVEEGVTQTGQEVTAIVAENFLKYDTSVGVMCKQNHAEIFPVDMGMVTDTKVRTDHKIAYGTQNMTKGPAMTREQAVQALEVGIHMVEELKEKGYGIVATGEMGIGNTTTSSAVTAVLLEQDPAEVTGRGAGLSGTGLKKKISVIRDAIALHKPKKEDPIDVLAKVGGLDIAGMAGVFLGGAACRIPVVADGFISCVAALCAIRICPAVKDYVITSHKSKEPATMMILEALDIPVFLDCDMCLGEGTGAVTIYPILDMALAVYGGMCTFSDNQMENYVPLV